MTAPTKGRAGRGRPDRGQQGRGTATRASRWSKSNQFGRATQRSAVLADGPRAAGGSPVSPSAVSERFALEHAIRAHLEAARRVERLDFARALRHAARAVALVAGRCPPAAGHAARVAVLEGSKS